MVVPPPWTIFFWESPLLHGLEHCVFGVRDRRCLDGFFFRLAKRVMHLKYDYYLSYVEAERQLGVKRPSTRLALERLRWTGQMLRSEDTVLPKSLPKSLKDRKSQCIPYILCIPIYPIYSIYPIYHIILCIPIYPIPYISYIQLYTLYTLYSIYPLIYLYTLYI